MLINDTDEIKKLIEKHDILSKQSAKISSEVLNISKEIERLRTALLKEKDFSNITIEYYMKNISHPGCQKAYSILRDWFSENWFGKGVYDGYGSLSGTVYISMSKSKPFEEQLGALEWEKFICNPDDFHRKVYKEDLIKTLKNLQCEKYFPIMSRYDLYYLRRVNNKDWVVSVDSNLSRSFSSGPSSRINLLQALRYIYITFLES